MPELKGKVRGIGGIFLKSADQDRLRAWYAGHLGIEQGPFGGQFNWRAHEEPARELVTAWNIFPASSPYFDPSTAPFMINYIVDDLDSLVEKLTASGVRVDPKREDYDYGRFAWVYDADGNKVELWEPPRAPTAAETFAHFVGAINAHDVAAIAALLTVDHVFTDAVRNQVRGARSMEQAWRQYFAMCPDYRVRTTDVLAQSGIVLAVGEAGGTIDATPWRMPAAWKAVVQDGKVAEWQVFVDSKPVYEILARRR
jgi:ketosteroid isomerase-like protein/catechol 2,3-dioxygenase-like lactoylglutathione lyase family enzyme